MQAHLHPLTRNRVRKPQTDERNSIMNRNRNHLAAILALVFATSLLGVRALAQDLTWTGSVDGNWNETTANWTGDASVYTDGSPGDAVNFVGGINRTIAIADTYSPAGIGFDNASGTNFSFSGGGISGSGAFTKAGAGDAIFDASTDFGGYSGAIDITAGRLLRGQTTGDASFGSGTITLDGGGLGLVQGSGWSQPAAVISNPIVVTANGGRLVGIYADGNTAAYTGGITLAENSTLHLEASGSAGNAYTLNLGAITLDGDATIQRHYTAHRRPVELSGDVSGAGHTLTLDSVNTRLLPTGSFNVGNLNIANELWVENRGGNAFVTLGSGGKVTVADGGILALGHTTIAAADLVLESGSQLRHIAGNWEGNATISGDAVTISDNRTVWLSQQGGGNLLNFQGGVTFESGSLLGVGGGNHRAAGIGGTATFLGGATIEGSIPRTSGTVLRSGPLVFGDADPNTAETITIKGQGAGVMAFVASSPTINPGVTLRYEAASDTSPFKVGWGATGWNGGTGALTASLVAGTAGTEFAPFGSGTNGGIVAIGTTAGTVFTASQPTTVVSAGTVEFRNSASSGSDNWQAGDLGPVVVASGGSFTTAVTGATVEASTITVEDAGLLGGIGTFRAAVDIEQGGLVTPGTSIGTLTIDGDATFNDGAILAIDIAGANSDRLIVTDTLNLLDGAVLEIFGTPTIEVPYHIATYGSLGGELEFTTVLYDLTPYELLYGEGVGGNEIWFTAIPEPTTAVLLGLAAAGLLSRRRHVGVFKYGV